MTTSSYTGTTLEEDRPQDLQPSTRFLGTLRSHSPSRRASSAISKTYKAASTLYLTRRLQEAYQTIEPLINAAKPPDDEDEEEEAEAAAVPPTPPPIATANRSLRVKVWNFYLTLLNAIIELGPEDGRNDFGSTVWRGLVNKVRDGSIWEEVVRSGYGGREGSVDADVVANLATLLLGQSPSQTLTQQRLETYLSFSSQPELALADRLDGLEPGTTMMQRRPSHASGTNTPRDLNSRAKVLELYTLHVLPRNEEWETSREFIRASNELDDERKDAFLYTLDTLQEQAANERDHENELLRQRDEELARRRQEAEAKRLEESRLLEERSRASEAASIASSSKGAPPSSSSLRGQQQQQHHRTNSEVDYGIEDSKIKRPPPPRKKESTSKALKNPQQHATSSGGTSRGGGGGGLPRATAKPKKAPPRTLIQRIPALLGLIQKLLTNAARTATKDPTTMLKYFLFLLAFLLAFARRGVRERIGRITGLGWGKIKATIGMGTKVSYI